MGRRTCRVTPGAGGLRSPVPGAGGGPAALPAPAGVAKAEGTDAGICGPLFGRGSGTEGDRRAFPRARFSPRRQCGEGRRELSGVAGGDDGRALTRHRVGAGGLC